MVMATEELNELETALKEPETKSETVPEETEEIAEEKEPEELTAEEQAKAQEGKVKEEKSLSPEEAFERKVQSKVDMLTKSLRGKREADTAYILSLEAQRAELKKQIRILNGDKRLAKLLGSYDEEGEDSEKKESFAEQVKAINKQIDEFNEKSAEVEETAQFIKEMTEKLSPEIIRKFGLDDPNPNIRATNGIKLLDDAFSVMKYHDDFLMAMGEFFPKGGELRKQLEKLVDGMAKFKDEESKKLFLESQLKGLKFTPRKAPPAPSDDSGGMDLSKLSGEELLRQAVAEDRRKGK